MRLNYHICERVHPEVRARSPRVCAGATAAASAGVGRRVRMELGMRARMGGPYRQGGGGVGLQNGFLKFAPGK